MSCRKLQMAPPREIASDHLNLNNTLKRVDYQTLTEVIMSNEFRVDLRIARTRSGLSGRDLAHLLECGVDRISKLENGAARITPRELAKLQIIWGKPFEESFAILSQEISQTLFNLLGSIPEEPAQWAGKRQLRLSTLDALSQRLADKLNPAYDT